MAANLSERNRSFWDSSNSPEIMGRVHHFRDVSDQPLVKTDGGVSYQFRGKPQSLPVPAGFIGPHPFMAREEKGMNLSEPSKNRLGVDRKSTRDSLLAHN